MKQPPAGGRHGLRVVSLVAAVASVAGLLGCSKPAPVEMTLFKDVTAESGLGAYTGMTFGAAWGDFDGDGRPDVYVTDHLNDARLYRNLGGGHFADVTGQYFKPADLTGDKHGAVWADFDNDGRLDLMQMLGAKRGVGVNPKRLFRNTGQALVDVADAEGVANPLSRGRMPMWLDINGDGKLDLFEGAEARLDNKTPPFLFVQGAQRFEVATPMLPVDSRGPLFCMLAGLTGAETPGLLCRLEGMNAAVQEFDLSTLPAKSLNLLPQTAFDDAASADFDHDGRMDLFLARRNPPGPVAFGRHSKREIVAGLNIDAKNTGGPMGFNFRAKGSIQLELGSADSEGTITPERVYLGAGGVHPAAMTFPVSPDVGSLAAGAPGGQDAVYVGFTAPDRWDVRMTARADDVTKGRSKDLEFVVTAEDDIADLKAVGQTAAEEAPARLFMNHGDKLVEESDKRGVNQRLVAGASVVTGDFDNDMNDDLFVVASGAMGQQENLLLLNDGTGHFRVVKDAGGAIGSTTGVGDCVTTADFDDDGRLGLLITNGGSMGRSFGVPAERGGYRLYRNIATNGNHWIEIDLQGTRSNRDGIGAVVRVRAGGVTQTHVQDGGMHACGQNQARLHFGLAKNTVVEKISIRWPTGQAQELRDVKADQVLKIAEPS
jgi:hypothetical protein